MSSCIFCDIIEGDAPSRKIWEDEHLLAFLDINPINPGHVLFIPKIHVEYLFDMKEAYLDLFTAAKTLAEPLRRATGAKRIALAVEGFAVPHVHLHLVPVNGENELDPKRARPASKEELVEMEKKIKKELTSFS